MSSTLIPFTDAAFAAGVKHLTCLSVDGARNWSWVRHRGVEEHLQTTNGSWIVLRPGFCAQNLGVAYRCDLLHNSRLFVPAANARVAFLDVADVGDVAATQAASTTDNSSDSEGRPRPSTPS